MFELNDFTIIFPNGRLCRYNIDDFVRFGSVNEHEHKSENIIINMTDHSKSFSYEVDEFGEIVNKEPITISKCNMVDTSSKFH